MKRHTFHVDAIDADVAPARPPRCAPAPSRQVVKAPPRCALRGTSCAVRDRRALADDENLDLRVRRCLVALFLAPTPGLGLLGEALPVFQLDVREVGGLKILGYVEGDLLRLSTRGRGIAVQTNPRRIGDLPGAAVLGCGERLHVRDLGQERVRHRSPAGASWGAPPARARRRRTPLQPKAQSGTDGPPVCKHDVRPGRPIGSTGLSFDVSEPPHGQASHRVDNPRSTFHVSARQGRLSERLGGNPLSVPGTQRACARAPCAEWFWSSSASSWA